MVQKIHQARFIAQWFHQDSVMVQKFLLALIMVQKLNQAHAIVQKFHITCEIVHKFQLGRSFRYTAVDTSIMAQHASNHRQVWSVKTWHGQ